ncbi:MAG: 4Fe-4S dicluster domain-containing protein, partial [Vallitaleaceae bacterium]|nr:4Fe-4S dicluster domain-containing protein [Vallitaleaceae bacterium]
AEIALRYVLANPNVSCALSGMGTLEMVEENVRVATNGAALTGEELEKISGSMEENKKMSDLYCTGCNYCMPCPHEVNIPLNFQFMNYHRVLGITDFAKSEYAQIGKNQWLTGKNAAACVDCGICETKCPQKIEIRKQLKETAAALG